MLDVTRTLMQAAALAYELTASMPKGKNLGDQLRRSSSGSALQAAEGTAMRGARRNNHLEVAYGSCREARDTTHLLAVIGEIDLEGGRRLWTLLDRGCQMLWRMTR